MKNSFVIIGIIVLLLVGAGFFYLNSKSATGQVINESADVQKITLSMKNGNYYPQTVTVKAGTPVIIYLDSSVGGCLRAFTIPSLGIAKNLKTASDYVEFTPKDKGTFRFQCSMNMGYGNLIVE